MPSPLSLPYAYGEPALTADLRVSPDDFIVDEMLGFSPSGHGEHLFVLVEKRNANTHYVAEALARQARIKSRDVGYAGIKDRRALCRQWFSLALPGKTDPDFSGWCGNGWRVLDGRRHDRKLRRGVHRGNRFDISLRQCAGDVSDLAHRIELITQLGVPNYFGEQRFGRDGDNVVQALSRLSTGRPPSRHQRSIYLSALRSFLFNQVLARRVVESRWNQLVAGDILMLAGTGSVFPSDDSADLIGRVESGDLTPTGLLYGSPGKLTASSEALAIELAVAEEHRDICGMLDRADVGAARRALRVIPGGFSCQRTAGDTLHCTFTLPRGSYATAVLRELCQYRIINSDE